MVFWVDGMAKNRRLCVGKANRVRVFQRMDEGSEHIAMIVQG